MTSTRRVAITGASGFVGQALTKALQADGHTVLRLVRRADTAADAVTWSPSLGTVDADKLGRVDAIVHLAGESVAGGRWTKARKQAIAESRGPTTERLCRALAGLATPPQTLICASATGIYGNRGDEDLTEASGAGDDFLAKVAAAWEAATAPAAAAGIRVVNLRIGIVLDHSGGALARMSTPFRLGIAGRLGSGKQWMSWITLHDLVRAIVFAMARDDLRGPVLAVAPNAVTNQTFTKALGHVLRRPTFLAAPALALRLLLGEMANALLLASTRCRPTRLLAAGFSFDHPTIDLALPAALRR